MNLSIIQTEEKHKFGAFTLLVDGKDAGLMEYTRLDDQLIRIDHTEVNEEFGGQGLAKKLVLAAVEYARANHQKIIPICAYAHTLFDKMPEIQDVRHTEKSE